MDGSIGNYSHLDTLLTEVRLYLAAEQPELAAETLRDLIRIEGRLLIRDEHGPYDYYEVVIGVILPRKSGRGQAAMRSMSAGER